MIVGKKNLKFFDCRRLTNTSSQHAGCNVSSSDENKKLIHELMLLSAVPISNGVTQSISCCGQYAGRQD